MASESGIFYNKKAIVTNHTFYVRSVFLQLHCQCAKLATIKSAPSAFAVCKIQVNSHKYPKAGCSLFGKQVGYFGLSKQFALQFNKSSTFHLFSQDFWFYHSQSSVSRGGCAGSQSCNLCEPTMRCHCAPVSAGRIRHTL